MKNPWISLGDWVERRAQTKAFVKATGNNFQSRISKEEKEILRQRKEVRKVGRSKAEVDRVASADLRLISDRYRPELLFDDKEFYGFKKDYSTQTFLADRGCFLAQWKEKETGDLAARIIDESCEQYGLDQRIILISLQREQSAISAKKPLPPRTMNRILGFGALDGVREGQVIDLPRFYGFRKQIENGARRYVELGKEWTSGKTITVDYRKGTVAPLNGPTWSMYRYTPHTGAGKLSYLIGRWFGF